MIFLCSGPFQYLTTNLLFSVKLALFCGSLTSLVRLTKSMNFWQIFLPVRVIRPSENMRSVSLQNRQHFGRGVALIDVDLELENLVVSPCFLIFKVQIEWGFHVYLWKKKIFSRNLSSTWYCCNCSFLSFRRFWGFLNEFFLFECHVNDQSNLNNFCT